MSLLDEWRQIHAQMVATAEQFGRLLAQAESKAAAKAVGAPTQIEYDREQLAAPPRPVQPAPAQVNGDGEYETFQATTLHVTDDGERKTFKAKGGQWKKWGVFVWPEVLESEFGLDPDALGPGMYEFKHACRVLMDGKNPKKVVGLA